MGVGPGGPGRREFVETGGLGGGLIAEFGGIGGEVVELPGGIFLGGLHGFPGAVTDGLVVVLLPIEPAVGGKLGAAEQGRETAADEGLDGLAGEFARVGRAGDLEDGGHEIAEVADRGRERAGFGFQAGGPVGDEGRRDAAFVQAGLVAAKGCVGGIGPAGAVGGAAGARGAPARARRSGLVHGRERAAAEIRVGFGAAAVVGEEKDERVFELPALAQVRDQAADIVIHAVDLGRVHGHAIVELRVFLGLECIPSARTVVARGELRVSRHDAELTLAGEALLAEPVPTAAVAAGEFLDILVARVQRPVRRGEGEVEEERLCARMLAEELDRVVREGVGDVIVLLRGRGERRVIEGEAAGCRGRVERTRARDEPVETVEAARERPFFRAVVAEVPLAGEVAAVAGGSEHLRERDSVAAQDFAVTERRGGRSLLAGIFGERAHAGLMRIEAGEEGGPRGRAARGVVKLREAQAALREGVEVRRRNFGAVGAEVGEAHVVGEDDDDVGAGGRWRGRAGGGRRSDGGREGEEGDGAGDERAHGEIVFDHRWHE